jgi:ketosteroid isomerase-like protein
MSQENVDLVRRSIEATVVDGEPPWDALHEEIEVHDHDMLDAGEYRGHAGFARWLEDWSAAWAEDAVEPEEFVDVGERVVVHVLQKTTGHGSGVTLERHDAMVFAVREGKIVRLDYYNNREQALKAVGLDE